MTRWIRTLCIALTPLLLVPALPALGNILILDMNRDGLDLGGEVTTDLAGGGMRHIRWTKQNTDDCMLMVDADALRLEGTEISDAAGVAVTGLVMIRDGLRIRLPGGPQDILITDGWEMFAAFDQNNDGKISAADPVWPHLTLFMDMNGDGLVQLADDTHAPPVIRLREIPLSHGPPHSDPDGNLRTDGSWIDEDGVSGQFAGFELAELPVPAQPATWSRIKSFIP